MKPQELNDYHPVIKIKAILYDGSEESMKAIGDWLGNGDILFKPEDGSLVLESSSLQSVRLYLGSYVYKQHNHDFLHTMEQKEFERVYEPVKKST